MGKQKNANMGEMVMITTFSRFRFLKTQSLLIGNSYAMKRWPDFQLNKHDPEGAHPTMDDMNNLDLSINISAASLVTTPTAA